MAVSFNRPGVVVESFPSPVDSVFRTGVAGFVGPAVAGVPPATATLPLTALFTSWLDFADAFRDGPAWRRGTWRPDPVLWTSVRGFFLNGGTRCYVVLYDPAAADGPTGALDLAVAALADFDDVDLVCAPSLLGPYLQALRAPGAASEQLPALLQQAMQLQQQLIRSCESRRDDWFLILDAPPPLAGGAPSDLGAAIAALRAAPSDRPQSAAVYYPPVVPGGDIDPPPGGAPAVVPPSGHIAGIFARTDEQRGVHKSPANEVIEGIVDVIAEFDDVAGINPIRALPGRGIRVWGARTLAVPSSTSDTIAFLAVQRLVLTLHRWLVRTLDWTVFETNDVRTWVRIHRELSRRLGGLFEQGALAGTTPDEAFYVKCDDENNPPDTRTAGTLQVDVGIAPAVPNEFIKIRLVRSAEGLTVS